MLRCGSYGSATVALAALPSTDGIETKEDKDDTLAAASATTLTSPSATSGVGAGAKPSQHLVSFNISLPSSKEKDLSEAEKAAMMRELSVKLKVASIHCCLLSRFLVDAARYFLGGALMLAVKKLAPTLKALVSVKFICMLIIVCVLTL